MERTMAHTRLDMMKTRNSYGEDVSGENNVHLLNKQYQDDDYRAYCPTSPACDCPCALCLELTDPDMRHVLDSQVNHEAREEEGE